MCVGAEYYSPTLLYFEPHDSKVPLVALIFDIAATFLQIMTYAIIGRALISWVDPQGTNPISRFLHELTEPIVGPIRSVVPRLGMIDISPIFAILLLQILRQMLVRMQIG